MIFRFRAAENGQFWKVRVFMAASEELSAQLTGTLMLTPSQYDNLKDLLESTSRFNPKHVVTLIEERGN